MWLGIRGFSRQKSELVVRSRSPDPGGLWLFLRLRLELSVLSYSTDAAVFRMTIEHFSPVPLPQFG